MQRAANFVSIASIALERMLVFLGVPGCFLVSDISFNTKAANLASIALEMMLVFLRVPGRFLVSDISFNTKDAKGH